MQTSTRSNMVGPRPALDAIEIAEIRDLIGRTHEGRWNYTQGVAERYGVSVRTVYRYLRRDGSPPYPPSSGPSHEAPASLALGSAVSVDPIVKRQP